MPPKKRPLSEMVGRTPPMKPKPRGRPSMKNVQKDTGPNATPDLVDLTTLPRVKNDLVFVSYPFENLNLASTIEGTTKAVQDAVLGVVNDHVVRCSIPIDKMASICKRLLAKFKDRRIERARGSSPLLEATLDEAFAEISEGDINIDKSVFRLELIKYILIASSQHDKLAPGTMFSMIVDLHTFGLKMHEYETGAPPKVSSTIEHFYGLTKHEFACRTEQDQLKMRIEYVRDQLRYCDAYAKYLIEMHKKLHAKGNPDSINPLKDVPNGKAQEDELVESFKKNQNNKRTFKIEYERLTTKDESLMSTWIDRYRTCMLKDDIGVRTEEEEAKLARDFANTPVDVMKKMMPIQSENIEVKIRDSPIKRSKAKPLQYEHHFVPTPSIHLNHDPF